MICFIKLISVTQGKKVDLVPVYKVELKALPLIQFFLERRFCFSFVVMERIESLGGKNVRQVKKLDFFLTLEFCTYILQKFGTQCLL